jgi:hypothetical protein
MSIPFLFTSGIIVVILFIVGLLFTFKEFKDMNEHPESYRFDRSDDPRIIEKKSKPKP